MIRFIADYMDDLPAPIVHQMIDCNDIPCALVPLLEQKPWLRENREGKTEKWEDMKWQVVENKDLQKLTKIEAQIWLTIYNIFLSSTAGRRYEITHFRKENLLRLRKYMNEVLIDQLPMLTDFHRALEEMALKGESSLTQSNAFIVEALPELRTRIMKDKDWKKIAAMQGITFFAKDTKQAKEDMDRMLKLYTDDVYEDFMEDPQCAECGAPATQRCSRCKNIWYCSREH